MINMIRADLYRITKNPVFYIAVGIVLIMLTVSIVVAQPGTLGTANASVLEDTEMMQMNMDELNTMGLSDMRNFMLGIEGYKLDKEILAVNMNLYYVFIFISVLIITTDFSGGSVKNTLSSSIRRSRYFISKSVITFIICLIFFLANNYLAYFSNLIFNGKKVSSNLALITKISIIQMPAIIAIIAFLTGTAFIIRKTQIYNVIVIPVVMVYQIIAQLLTNVFGVSRVIVDYELQNMLSSLSSDPSGSYIRNSYIICGIITVVFLAAGWLIFRKSEIK